MLLGVAIWWTRSRFIGFLWQYLEWVITSSWYWQHLKEKSLGTTLLWYEMAMMHHKWTKQIWLAKAGLNLTNKKREQVRKMKKCGSLSQTNYRWRPFEPSPLCKFLLCCEIWQKVLLSQNVVAKSRDKPCRECLTDDFVPTSWIAVRSDRAGTIEKQHIFQDRFQIIIRSSFHCETCDRRNRIGQR